MNIRAIITGSTGMVGEGVLHACLHSPDVEHVLVINRRPCMVKHKKLKEIIHVDFSDFSNIENELAGYNAAYLCMGVSSVGMKEEKYHHITYDFTMALARPLARINPDITICYISGVGTDATEKGRIMWARVKGKTENHLLQLHVKKACMFRPGGIIPTKGLKNTYTIYKILSPVLPVFRYFFPRYICSLEEIGEAMIKCSLQQTEKKVLEVRDIVALAGL